MQFGIDEFNGRLAGIAISVPHPVQQSRKRWLNFPRVFWVARHFRSVYSGGNHERNRNFWKGRRSGTGSADGLTAGMSIFLPVLRYTL